MIISAHLGDCILIAADKRAMTYDLSLRLLRTSHDDEAKIKLWCRGAITGTGDSLFTNLFDGKSFFYSTFIQSLKMNEFLRDSYQTALNNVPVLSSDSPDNLRMRKITHIHLTRYVQSLLDRKDRMSMAVGLELRVPFCDHRLVEYAFNIPWEMKKFDGREKSILRAAAKDLLPPSIVQRIKNPYPATQDPAYEIELRKKRNMLSKTKALIYLNY
ncbi:asparagine synthase family protein [Acinetobacter sp. 1542444]|nr:asparagine synthase family protein [Acinetobacter sp. 1542444]